MVQRHNAHFIVTHSFNGADFVPERTRDGDLVPRTQLEANNAVAVLKAHGAATRVLDSRYEAVPGDGAAVLHEKAYKCGYELGPNDRLAGWLDDDSYAAFLDSYHDGQGEQFSDDLFDEDGY